MASRRLLVERLSQPIAIMSTALNSLANDAAVLSAAIANGTERDLYADWLLDVTFGSAPTANGRVELWLVRTLDASTYEDGAAGPILPQNGFIGSFVLRAVTTQQRIIVPHPPHILLPPLDFKVLAVNRSGQAFPASGSTITALFYREEIA